MIDDSTKQDGRDDRDDGNDRTIAENKRRPQQDLHDENTNLLACFSPPDWFHLAIYDTWRAFLLCLITSLIYKWRI